MRGGVSFALAMTLDDTRKVNDLISEITATRIVTTTLLTIVFTNFVMAPLTGPLIRALKLGGDSDASDAPELEAQSGAPQPALPPASQSRSLDSPLLTELSSPKPKRTVPTAWIDSKIHRMWRMLDEEYMKPLFGGAPRQSCSTHSLSNAIESWQPDDSDMSPPPIVSRATR
mmetsp:Transcript_24162/g.56116  ORF Transcript_24162/g.56116 Transcript_24162/m.56116 type:complete len:172 (-) Transcript_24162:108-623(-)